MLRLMVIGSEGFQSGNTYDFKIVTMRGSNFEVQYTDYP